MKKIIVGVAFFTASFGVNAQNVDTSGIIFHAKIFHLASENDLSLLGENSFRNDLDSMYYARIEVEEHFPRICFVEIIRCDKQNMLMMLFRKFYDETLLPYDSVGFVDMLILENKVKKALGEENALDRERLLYYYDSLNIPKIHKTGCQRNIVGYSLYGNKYYRIYGYEYSEVFVMFNNEYKERFRDNTSMKNRSKALSQMLEGVKVFGLNLKYYFDKQKIVELKVFKSDKNQEIKLW